MELPHNPMASPDHHSLNQAERGMRAALTGLKVNAAMVVVKLLAGILGQFLRPGRRRHRVFDRHLLLPHRLGRAPHHDAARRRRLSLRVRQGRDPGRGRRLSHTAGGGHRHRRRGRGGDCHPPPPARPVHAGRHRGRGRREGGAVQEGTQGRQGDGQHRGQGRRVASPERCPHLGRRLHRHRGRHLGRPRLGVGRRLVPPSWPSAIIAVNGVLLLRPAIRDLMDRMPEDLPAERIAAAARGVDGVRAIEKLRVRRLGTEYFVDLHVQADPMLPLRDAHILSGKVKGVHPLGNPPSGRGPGPHGGRMKGRTSWKIRARESEHSSSIVEEGRRR